jgi:pyruvate/2-oxoglutarate dehydrogenase complex dihydrolipoamide acyltransferase (E2) component
MRTDGIPVKNVDPMHTLMSRLLPRRCDSTVMVTLNIPLDPIRSYTRIKRRESRPVSHLAVIVAASLRTMRDYPNFNRFVHGGRLYRHDGFSISMMILRSVEDDDATMPKIRFGWDDNIFEVSRKIEEQIAANRSGKAPNEVDKITNSLLALPGSALFVGGLLRFLDRRGIMPRSLVKESPFHASMAISNMASLNTPHIYHHLYEIGSISWFMTLGTEQFSPAKIKDEVTATRCIPLTLTIDERICSGAYFALGFARLRHYLANPALLEN